MNVRNRAISQYRNTYFSSMCLFDGEVWGGDSLGLSMMSYENESDDGDAITWFAEFVAVNFGVSNRKTVRSVHLSGYSDGNIAVSWDTDQGTTNTETVTEWGSSPGYNDIKTNGNMKVEGTYLSFTVLSNDGADVILDALRVVPIVKPLGKNRA